LLDKIVRQTFVVSLAEDENRRSHIRKHFDEIGIKNYSFVEATPSTADSVKNLYVAGTVATYPSCFRCHQNSCDCGNNIIIPHQVANWLSFVETWRKVASCDGWSLICEDDVLFYEDAIPKLNQFMSEHVAILPQSPVLLRLANSGLDSSVSLEGLEALSLSQRTVMSNVAHIMNKEMALHLLDKFDRIETTSDIWVHKLIAEDTGVVDLTVEPLIATDLSYNKEFARFTSRIHPKGIDAADIDRANRHIKRVTSDKDYFTLLESWLGNKASTEKCLVNSGLRALCRNQIDLIAKLSPEQPKRKYSGQLDAALEKEYGFRNTFEKWTSVDKDNNPIPWMTYSAIFYLQQLNLKNSSVFEWGSGNSSLYFSNQASNIVSIESNPEWFDYVKRHKQANQDVVLRSQYDYCSSINEYQERFDVIVIDGDIFRRLECAKYAIKKLAHGGIIVLDNSDWLPNTTAFLRYSGFTQIDFAGPGPINSYLWCTSVFFKGGISIPSIARARPGFLASGIHNVRDKAIPFLQESARQQKEQAFTENYASIKQDILPPNTDVFASQEGEDVLLRRLLKWYYHKPGFYVDVGAHDPIRFSNTYHFYLQSWTGINIDPRIGTKARFDALRPKDTNLELGVANTDSELVYYEFKEPAFNTFDKSSVEYAKTRTELLGESRVLVKTLSSILDEHVDDGQPITFCNIDVEGLEIEVLKSNNWQRYRPLILVVEALTLDVLAEVDQFLITRNYTRVASTKNSYFFCENKFWEEVK
jgi:FkbM family methyltransferase